MNQEDHIDLAESVINALGSEHFDLAAVMAVLLESEAMRERRFQPKGDEHRAFTVQIISSTVGKRDTFRLVGKRNSPIIIEMTDAEFLEASVKLDFYWSDWLAQKEVFYSAYIQKQRLFRKPSGEKLIGEEPELSLEELQRLKKLFSMRGH